MSFVLGRKKKNTRQKISKKKKKIKLVPQTSSCINSSFPFHGNSLLPEATVRMVLLVALGQTNNTQREPVGQE